MISHLTCYTHKNVEPCKGNIDEVSMEGYYDISVDKNSHAAGRLGAHEDIYTALAKSQLESAKVLVSSRNWFSTTIPVQKMYQSTITSGFQGLSQSNIWQSNDAQLKMAIVDFSTVKTFYIE